MLRPVAHELRRSMVVGLGLGLVAGVLAYVFGGWHAVAGVWAGVVVMMVATAGAVVHAAAVLGRLAARTSRLVGSLSSFGSLAVALGCFWWAVNYAGAPGWSLAVGVTAMVVGLVCGFGLRANRLAK